MEPTEEFLRQRIEDYRKAYETRAIDAIVDCFADDGPSPAPEGTQVAHTTEQCRHFVARR